MTYSATVLADTPQAYYKCDDASGNLVDSSGNGHTMTLYSGQGGYRERGPDGFATAVDASNARWDATIPGLSQAAYTLECWLRISEQPTNACPFGQWGGDNATGAMIWVDSGNLYAFHGTPSVVGGVYGPSSSFDYWVVTWDGTTRLVYKNASVVATTSVSSAPGTSSGPWQISGYGNLVQSTGRFLGWIAHAAYYTSALSATKISGHYSAMSQATPSYARNSVYQAAAMADSPLTLIPMDTDLNDISGNARNGVAHEGLLLGAAGPFGQGAAAFDGVDDYGLIGGLASALGTLHACTVELWVNWADNTNDGIYCEYTANSNTGTTGNPAGFYIYNGGDGNLYFNLGPSFPDDLSYCAAPAINTWNHIVAVFDYTQAGGSEIKVYINGVAQALTVSGSNNVDHASSTTFASDNMYLGSRAGSSFFGVGAMSWFAVYPTALSAGRIAAHYNASLPASPIVSSGRNIPLSRRRRMR